MLIKFKGCIYFATKVESVDSNHYAFFIVNKHGRLEKWILTLSEISHDYAGKILDIIYKNKKFEIVLDDGDFCIPFVMDGQKVYFESFAPAV